MEWIPLYETMTVIREKARRPKRHAQHYEFTGIGSPSWVPSSDESSLSERSVLQSLSRVLSRNRDGVELL